LHPVDEVNLVRLGILNNDQFIILIPKKWDLGITNFLIPDCDHYTAQCVQNV